MRCVNWTFTNVHLVAIIYHKVFALYVAVSVSCTCTFYGVHVHTNKTCLCTCRCSFSHYSSYLLSFSFAKVLLDYSKDHIVEVLTFSHCLPTSSKQDGEARALSDGRAWRGARSSHANQALRPENSPHGVRLLGTAASKSCLHQTGWVKSQFSLIQSQMYNKLWCFLHAVQRTSRWRARSRFEALSTSCVK